MDDRQAITQPRGFSHDVSRVDDALALVSQGGHGGEHRAGDQHVETGRGFVENQNRRVVNQGAGDRDLLSHTRGKPTVQRVSKLVHR